MTDFKDDNFKEVKRTAPGVKSYVVGKDAVITVIGENTTKTTPNDILQSLQRVKIDMGDSFYSAGLVKNGIVTNNINGKIISDKAKTHIGIDNTSIDISNLGIADNSLVVWSKLYVDNNYLQTEILGKKLNSTTLCEGYKESCECTPKTQTTYPLIPNPDYDPKVVGSTPTIPGPAVEVCDSCCCKWNNPPMVEKCDKGWANWINLDDILRANKLINTSVPKPN